MDLDSLEFLNRLLDTPGPSGFEAPPARVWREEARTFAETVDVDVAGNSIASVNHSAQPRLMFAGHIDEIGLMIHYIDDDGFLFFSPIGGWDSQILVGQRVVIETRDGPVYGVIGKKPVHLIKSEDREAVTKISDLWIDIGSTSKKESAQRVRIGDPAVLDSRSLALPSRRIAARSIDNRIGAFVVLEALRMLTKDKAQAAVFAVATSREEIAWTGGGARTSATALEPAVALVVDVTHATDYPGVEKKEHGEYKLGGGVVLSRGSAVNPRVFDLLVEAAETDGIPYSIAAAPKDTGTDADAIHVTNRGIPTGLVSVPNRYMHSPNEMVDLGDIESAARLLAGFARRITPETDLVPR